LYHGFKLPWHWTSTRMDLDHLRTHAKDRIKAELNTLRSALGSLEANTRVLRTSGGINHAEEKALAEADFILQSPERRSQIVADALDSLAAASTQSPTLPSEPASDFSSVVEPAAKQGQVVAGIELRRSDCVRDLTDLPSARKRRRSEALAKLWDGHHHPRTVAKFCRACKRTCGPRESVSSSHHCRLCGRSLPAMAKSQSASAILSGSGLASLEAPSGLLQSLETAGIGPWQISAIQDSESHLEKLSAESTSLSSKALPRNTGAMAPDAAQSAAEVQKKIQQLQPGSSTARPELTPSSAFQLQQRMQQQRQLTTKPSQRTEELRLQQQQLQTQFQELWLHQQYQRQPGTVGSAPQLVPSGRAAGQQSAATVSSQAAPQSDALDRVVAELEAAGSNSYFDMANLRVRKDQDVTP